MFPMKPHSGSASSTLAFVSLIGLVLTLAMPTSAHAGKRMVSPSMSVSVGYDDNVLNDEVNQQDSFFTRLRPKLFIERESDSGTTGFTLGGTGRIYEAYSDLNSFDVFSKFEIERQITKRLTLVSNIRFDDYSKRDRFEDDNAIFGGRPDQQDTAFGGGLRYLIDSRSRLNIDLGYGSVDYDERLDISNLNARGRRDSTRNWGQVSVIRNLSLLDEVSVTSTYSETNLQDIGAGETDTTLWNNQIGWKHIISSRWDTRVSLGFRTLEKEFSGATVKTTGLVGSATVQRRFARGFASLSYSRDSKATSGGSSSVDVDTLTMRLIRKLSERVTFSLVGEARRYTSTGDVQDVDEGAFAPRHLVLEDGKFLEAGQTLPAKSILKEGTQLTGDLLENIDETFIDSGGVLLQDVPSPEFPVTLSEKLTFANGIKIAIHEPILVLLNDSSGEVTITEVPGIANAFPLIDCSEYADNVGAAWSGTSARCLHLIDNDTDRENLSLSARIDWRLKRRLTTFLLLKWSDFDSQDYQSSESYDKVIMSFGFRYFFDQEF
ncbi:MAG: hypothetical protein GY725_10395 [bacterium]|nr:hypothetical protein [bacterium]